MERSAAGAAGRVPVTICPHRSDPANQLHINCPTPELCRREDLASHETSIICRDAIAAKAGAAVADEQEREISLAQAMPITGGPKVTEDWIRGRVLREEYLQGEVEIGHELFTRDQVVDLGTMTICILTMRNGIKVVGTAACVDPANYDSDLGRQLAFKDAVSQIWPMEGYLLAEQMQAAKR